MSLTQQADVLSTRHLDADLKGHTVRSTAVTVTAQALKFGMQLVSIVVLARLLTPADFGLVAMVTVLTMLLAPLMDGGLSMATIQRQDITHAQVSNLFWLNAALGLGLSLLVVLAAPLIAVIYGEPRLTSIAIVMSVAFVVGGLAVQFNAVLRRQMRFKALAVVDVVSLAAGTVATVALAATGFGYWALVAGPLVGTPIQTLMVWRLGGWRPSWICRGAGTKPLVSFGLHLTGANVVGHMLTGVLPFAIGLVGGPQAAGYYNRANALVSIPATQLLPPLFAVFQPALCRVAGTPERLRAAILGILSKIFLVTVPATVFLLINAAPVVDLILGKEWNEAANIVQMLAVFVVVEPIFALLTISLIASGNSIIVLRWKLFSLTLIILSALIGSIWGVTGIVLAYSVSGILLRLPLFVLFCKKYLPVSISDLFRIFYPYMVLAVGFAGALAALNIAIGEPAAAESLIFSLPAAIAIYAVMGITWYRIRKEAMEVINLAVNLVYRRAT